MSSVRRERKLPSRCVSDPLEGERERGEASALRALLASCYGPRGRLKFLHNAAGGPTVATSTAAALLPALRPPGPVLRLLAAAACGHVARRGDGGLFAALLASLLLEGGWRVEVPPGVTARVQERLLQLCTSYLRSEECACRLRVDLGSLPRLLSLVLTVLGSKPACLLSRRSARHVAAALLRSFLLTVPGSDPAPRERGVGDDDDDERPTTMTLGHAVLVSAVGAPVEETRVLSGLLVDTPEAGAEGGSRGAEEPVRVAVFNVSLSGDVAEGDDKELHHEVEVGVSLHGATLTQLMSLGERLLALEVGILACQKVVHPVMRQRLEERGVRVIDRLGVALVEPLCRLTGARPLGSFLCEVSPAQLGLVRGTDAVSVGEKRFLRLRGIGAPVCTLVLCHRNDAALAELKLTCQAAQHALQALLTEPLALFGGGCTETHLASYIRHAAPGMSEELLQELRCSRAQAGSVAAHLAGALQAVACTLSQGDSTHLVDGRYGHLWVACRTPLPGEGWEAVLQSCECGAVASPPLGASWRWLGQRGHGDAASPGHDTTAPPLAPPDPPAELLLDSYVVRSSALQVAVEVASLLLDVKCTIEDTN